MARSYNGWTASRSPSSIGIDRAFSPVGNTLFPQGVRSGDVATVLTYLVLALHHRVEPIMTEPGCWGYYYKQNVNNPDTLSCHASGTAIDYNAPKHPNQVRYTWTAGQVREIKKILAELQGVVRWLEGYDEMHFEICKGATEVKRVANLIRTGKIGNVPTPAPATPPQEDLTIMDAATKAYLDGRFEAIEQRLTDLEGGPRARDGEGKVIDKNAQVISNADVFTAVEELRKVVNTIAANI